MKFTIASSVLQKHLKTAKTVIEPNPIISILRDFCWKIKDGRFTVIASDMQTTVITSMDVESDIDTEITIPAGALTDTINNLPDQPLVFDIDPNSFLITLVSDSGQYKLSGQNPIDFPKVDKSLRGESLIIPGSVLQKALQSTLVAVSTEDLKASMNAVYLQIRPEGLTFAATDGHRLSRYKYEVAQTATEHNLLIHRTTISKLKSILPNNETPIDISYSDKHVFFKFDEVEIICRQMDERFPDYEMAIPQTNNRKLTIERQPLLNALKRLIIYATKVVYLVRFKATDGKLEIHTENTEISSEAVERLSCSYEGEDIEIGLNAQSLSQLLSTIDDNMIVIEMSQPSRPCLILPAKQAEDQHLLLLLMPVMLNRF